MKSGFNWLLKGFNTKIQGRYMMMKNSIIKNKKNNASFDQRKAAIVKFYKEVLFTFVNYLERDDRYFIKYFFHGALLTATMIYFARILNIYNDEVHYNKYVHEDAVKMQVNEYIKNTSDFNKMAYSQELTKYY